MKCLFFPREEHSVEVTNVPKPKSIIAPILFLVKLHKMEKFDTNYSYRNIPIPSKNNTKHS